MFIVIIKLVNIIKQLICKKMYKLFLFYLMYIQFFINVLYVIPTNKQFSFLSDIRAIVETVKSFQPNYLRSTPTQRSVLVFVILNAYFYILNSFEFLQLGNLAFTLY